MSSTSARDGDTASSGAPAGPVLTPPPARAASLDHLARVAATVLGAHSAQVFLVADGRDASTADPTTGSVPERLCRLAVESAQVVRVDDVRQDPRTAAVSAEDPCIGAFLGVPLVRGDDAIGALGVYSSGPRHWTDAEMAIVEALADPILTELQMASLAADYEDERLVWQLAVDAAGVGAFDWDLTTGELRWDDRLLELFGLDHDTFGGTIESFEAAVHPHDRERVTNALQQAIESCGLYDAEYRVVLPAGEVRWIGARGRAVPGPDGQAVRVLGAASDTTAVRDEDARVSRVLEAMPTAFFQLDTDWRFVYANAEARRLLGGIGVDVIGAVIWELFPAAVGSEFEEQYRGAVASQRPVAFEAYYPPPLDGWYEIRAWPTPDGLSVYFIDITERRQAAQALERSERRAAVLTEVSQALTGTLDIDEAVARLGQLLVPGLGDWCVITRVDGYDGALGPDWRRKLRDVGWWHADPAMRPLVETYARMRVHALRDSSFVARSLGAGRLVAIPERAVERVAEVLEPGEARNIFVRLAPESAAVVPLRARGRTVGLVTIFRSGDRETFTTEDLATLEEVAGRAGLALDNARLYSEQRDLAQTLQLSMMTAPPQPDHLQVAVRYTSAADVAQVGGDWYDAFMQPAGATVVVIGDVVGHDTAAAAAMGQLRSLLRGIAVTTGDGPAEVLRRVDEAMATLLVDTTATAAIARFEATEEERRDGVLRLRWSNAGHPPPLVTGPPDQPDVRVLWGPQPDLLLGFAPDVPRDESEMVLVRGSTVLLYTDGLVERRGQPLDDGIDVLTSVFEELTARGLELEDLCDELLRRLLPERPEDDVAVVAVRLHPEDGPRPPAAGPEVVPPTVARD
ncbi:SpoIIE family protein phosphatase [Nocardioides sp.]|uniref:SpoIIE family protein phosphatase n=1 Tax=Nocardioides sp. TaxID=35761 RepID=UPI0025D9A6E3|nr:SpoIIE family protein phosphatase [Nocardioides sp.]